MTTRRETILAAVRTALTVATVAYTVRETMLIDDGAFVQIVLQKT